MARKTFTTEQIIGKLREVEVLLSQGQPLVTVCRGLEISEQTYYRWRKEYGGLRTDQALDANDAGFGGGIASYGTLIVSASTFQDNNVVEPAVIGAASARSVLAAALIVGTAAWL